MADSDDWQRFNTREAVEYARQGLRTLILINGGAAIALLAFLSRSTEGVNGVKAGLRWSLIAFAFGVLVGTLAYLVAYLSQLYFAENNVTGTHLNQAHGLRVIGIALAILSLLSFMVGAVLAAWTIG